MSACTLTQQPVRRRRQGRPAGGGGLRQLQGEYLLSGRASQVIRNGNTLLTDQVFSSIPSVQKLLTQGSADFILSPGTGSPELNRIEPAARWRISPSTGCSRRSRGQPVVVRKATKFVAECRSCTNPWNQLLWLCCDSSTVSRWMQALAPSMTSLARNSSPSPSDARPFARLACVPRLRVQPLS